MEISRQQIRQRQVKHAFLTSAVEQNIFAEPYPNYPAERYSDEWYVATEEPFVPAGPWDTQTTELPDQTQIEQYQKQGLCVDHIGRPIHPWFESMVKNKNIGVVAGRGFFWNWGENRTVDPIVFAGQKDDLKVLLITRQDTGILALPGGFIDSTDDDPIEAAKRELQEETGLTLETEPSVVYEGPVADKRATAHAWVKTVGVFWHIPEIVPVVAGDDAIKAEWHDFNQTPTRLFGSHKKMVEFALRDFIEK